MQQDKGVMSSQVLDCMAVDLGVAFSGETIFAPDGTQNSTSDCRVHRDDFRFVTFLCQIQGLSLFNDLQIRKDVINSTADCHIIKVHQTKG